MAKKEEPIVKTFYFSKDERLDLYENELAVKLFNRAMAGMQVNVDFVKHEAYKRIGITEEAPKGYIRTITYSLTDGSIVVTDTLMPKEEPKEKKPEDKNGKTIDSR